MTAKTSTKKPMPAKSKTKIQVEAPIVEVQAPTIEAPKKGIGAMIKELIGQGLSTDDILTKVKEVNPDAKTNRACVSWYRSDLKKKVAGGAVPAQV